MTFDLRNPFEGDALPQNLATLFVERIDLVRVFRILFDRFDVAVESKLFLVGAAADSRHHKHLVAPNDRTRMGQAGDRGLPTHVRLTGCVPFHWLRRTFGDAGRTLTTKLRPVLCRGCDKHESQEDDGYC